MTPTTHTHPWTNAPAPAASAIRPQVIDMSTDNIAELAIRAKELGDVIPLWYGEGDVVTPAFIRNAAKAALDQGMTFYIPNMRGYPPLTEALAAYQSRLYGRDIAIERATVTPSGMQAVMMAFELIVDMGQNVVYIEPQWPNIRNAIHFVGGEPRPVPLAYHDRDWKLDLDLVFAACDARTRAIAFSSPANPTGWVATPEELKALLAFSRKRGIWIVADEAYSRLYFDGDAAPSILSHADPEDLVLGIHTFSKAWAMTGWRVGWLTHPVSVAPAVAAMTQYVNSGTAGVLQVGAHAAMTQGESLVAEMRERCKTGVDLAQAALEAMPSVVTSKKPRGGMYVFFKLADEPDSKAACLRILDRSKVGLAPGYLFGDASKSFVRMCICRDPKHLEQALGRMVKVMS
jgi:aspartate aminotransferase